MNRRRFLGATATGECCLGDRPGLRTRAFATKHGTSPRKVLMHVGTQDNLGTDPAEAAKTLSYLKRHGVDHLCAYCSRADRGVDKLSQLRQLVESHGISLDMIDDMRLARTPPNAIMMGKSPERDRDIEAMCELIKNCAAVGHSCRQILFVIAPDSQHLPDDGPREVSSARTWKLSEYKDADRPTEAGPVPAELMWERDHLLPRAGHSRRHRVQDSMAHHPHEATDAAAFPARSTRSSEPRMD